jgi:hypothetical protein
MHAVSCYLLSYREPIDPSHDSIWLLHVPLETGDNLPLIWVSLRRWPIMA